MVCIAPKRLRLIASVCASVAYLVLAVPLALNLVDVLARRQLRYLLLTPLLLALLVTIPSCVLWGTWALVRLLTNLPAVILTPHSIINHSIIYRVVLPWDPIESFVQFQPSTHA
jgi:hypothetical protein